jgi:hypothetical protein
MAKRRKFTGQFKAKVALEALRGDKTIQEIAAKPRVHPNQVSTEPLLLTFLTRHICPQDVRYHWWTLSTHSMGRQSSEAGHLPASEIVKTRSMHWDSVCVTFIV